MSDRKSDQVFGGIASTSSLASSRWEARRPSVADCLHCSTALMIPCCFAANLLFVGYAMHANRPLGRCVLDGRPMLPRPGCTSANEVGGESPAVEQTPLATDRP